MLRSEHKVAIVTGGSRGLGHALCVELLAQGFRLIELSRTGNLEGSISVDLADVQAGAQRLRDVLLTVNQNVLDEVVCVVNAATVEPIGPLHEADLTAIQQSVNLSMIASMAVSQVVLSALSSARARKVLANISSGAAHHPHAGLAIYSACKAGTEQFARVVAAEQSAQPHPFIVVNLDPGALDTDMQSELRAADRTGFPLGTSLAQRHAMGELRDPVPVARDIVARLRSTALAQGERIQLGPATSHSKG